MKRGMIRAGTPLGISVDIHVALILYVLVVIFLGHGALIICELLAIFLHEFGHALTARATGMRVEGMELTPFGGIARIGGYMELTPKKEALIAISGPVVNLILITVSVYAAVVIFPILNPPEAVYIYSREFLKANIIIMAFNLLPALPLDGGRVTRAALTPVFGLARATKWCALFGMGIGVFLLSLGIFIIWYGMFNITFFTVGSYLFYAASRERRISPMLLISSAEKKRDTVRNETIAVRQMITNASMGIGEILSQFSPNRYHIVTIVDDQMQAIGDITEQQIISAWLSKGPLLPIGKLLS